MWFSRPLCSLASLAALLGAFAVGGCAYQLNPLAGKSGTDVAMVQRAQKVRDRTLRLQKRGRFFIAAAESSTRQALVAVNPI
jgi:hypothetical protein